MRALLVRVGIDSTPAYGKWNAPVDPATGEYVYVPIRQCFERYRALAGLRRAFDEVAGPLESFRHRHDVCREADLPARLAHDEMHLDPDFEHLTYGDAPTPRGRAIATVRPGDWLVFYAGLAPVARPRPLHYAIIGRYVVSEVLRASDIEPGRAAENAHTRGPSPSPRDVVVRADPACSGRLRRCLPIGELRGNPPRYRVASSLLKEWGGLASKDGWIHRGSPFELLDPIRFTRWFERQSPELVATNWDATARAVTAAGTSPSARPRRARARPSPSPASAYPLPA